MFRTVETKSIPVHNLNNGENIFARSNTATRSHFVNSYGSPNIKHRCNSFSISSVSKGCGDEAINIHTRPMSAKLNSPTNHNPSIDSLPSRSSTTLRHPRHNKPNVLRQRRFKTWKEGYPPRHYTTDAVVSALGTPGATLLQLPPEMILLLAQGATFSYLLPKEHIVYYNESHLSSGIVVLLHGQLAQWQPDKGAKPHERTAGSRPASSHCICTRYAPDVLCMVPVLCEDRSRSSFTCGPSESSDVAVISSRWFWQIFAHFAAGSPQSGMLLETFRKHILPLRTDTLLESYYPSPVLLQRSWIGHHLSRKDRLKLCSTMEVKVLVTGDVLFNAGYSCGYIYFLRRGTLTVVVKDQHLANFGPGTAFGEESALFGDPWNCTAFASSSLCELYAFPLGALNQRLEKKPTLADVLVHEALRRRKQWMEEGRKRSVCGLVPLLAGVPCLSHTTEAMRREIAQNAGIVLVPAGHKFARRNSPCECLYVIGRGFVRVARLLDLDSQHQASVTAVDEVRGVGDFFGELCLKPHCWPTDIISETSVDVWVIRREAILEILSLSKADAQAGVVCRQGIDLYRAQFGEHSILEVYDSRAEMMGSSPRHRKSSSLCALPNVARSSPTSKRSHSIYRNSLVGQAKTTLEEFDWVDYARQSRQKVLAATGFATSEGTYSHRRGDVSWMFAVEEAMKPKARSLISVPPDLPPSSADSDFPGEGDVLQAVVVEQLLLSPSEDHERFLYQLNNSKVTLVTETVPAGDSFNTFSKLENAASSGRAGLFVSGDEPLHEVVGPTGDTYVFEMETPKELEHLESSHSFTTVVDSMYNRSMSFDSDMYSPFGWENSENVRDDPFAHQPQRFPSSEHRRSSPISTHQPLPAPVSRIHHSRSKSSLHVSTYRSVPEIAVDRVPAPFGHAQVGTIVASDHTPLGWAVRNPSEARVESAITIVSPANVDHVEYRKHSTDRSSSILDRLVKIKDQNYFSTLVKVTPMLQDEFWIHDEPDDTPSEYIDKVSFVFALMYILECNNLDPALTSSCSECFLKVSVGERVLLRTTSLKDLVHPTWSVEESTFTSLLKRNSVMRFELCDRQQEKHVLYGSSFAISSTHKRDGVGKCILRLYPFSSAAEEPDLTADNRAGPHMTVSMIVVNINHATEMAPQRVVEDRSFRESPRGAVSLLVVGVRGLKHRISTFITATLRQDGDLVELLRTPITVSKTRAPSWPPQESFATVEVSGVIEFNLYHKDTLFASCELAADELVFGGVGLHGFFLTSKKEKGKVVGELLVYVLSTFLDTPVENQTPEKVMFLHAQKVSINQSNRASYLEKRINWVFDGDPDPFIVIRDTNGEVVLRTPMAFSSCEASWSTEDASCFLPFPNLPGSKTLYQLELYDNEEASTQLIDHVVFSVGHDGLGKSDLFDIELCRARAIVRLSASVLPMERYFHPPSCMRAPRAGYLTQDQPLVLLHVVRFHDGATLKASGGATAIRSNALWRKMQPDVVIRVEVCGKEYLRTPHESSRGRWPIHDGGVVLRLGVGAIHFDSMVVFEVFEGIVSEINKVGEAQVPLRELCTNGCRFLRVFSSRPETVYQSPHCIGRLEIVFFFGAVGSQVFTPSTAIKRLECLQSQEYSTDVKSEAETSAPTVVKKRSPPPDLLIHARVRFHLISLSNFSVEADLLDEHARLVARVTIMDGKKTLLLRSRAVPILTESTKSQHNGLSAVWEADNDTTVEIDIEQLQSQVMISVSVECGVCDNSSRSKASPKAGEGIHTDSHKKPFCHVLSGSIPLEKLTRAAIDHVQVDAVELTETVHFLDISLSSKTFQKGMISGKSGQAYSKPYLSFSFVAVAPPLSSDSICKSS